MKALGILLILVGLFGMYAGTAAYGDIGIACMIGGITALLSGIGFLIASGKIKEIQNRFPSI